MPPIWRPTADPWVGSFLRLLPLLGGALGLLLTAQVLFQFVFLLRHPLEDVIDASVHENERCFRVVQGEGDGLVLRRELGEGGDDTQRRPRSREGVGLPGERLQGDGELAVAQPFEQRTQVLAHLHEDDPRRSPVQALDQVDRRRGGVVADGEDLQRLAQGLLDIIDEAGEERTHSHSAPGERLRGVEQLLAQGREVGEVGKFGGWGHGCLGRIPLTLRPPSPTRGEGEKEVSPKRQRGAVLLPPLPSWERGAGGVRGRCG